MEIRHLRYFIAVAEELNFTRAAERLRISQPPLSTQIRQLEEELGTPLFERDRRHVTLTQGGRLLLVRAREILAAADQARDEVQSAGTGAIAKLVMGYAASAMFSVGLPRAIRSYRRGHPQSALELHEMTSQEQIHALLDQQIDIGILRRPDDAPPPGLRLEEWLTSPIVIALPADHPQAGQPAVEIGELRHDAFITYPRDLGIGMYWRVRELCRAAGFAPRVVREVRDASTIVGLVAAGVGVAVLPQDTSCIQLEGVVFKPLTGAGALATLSLFVAYRWPLGPLEDSLAPLLQMLREQPALARSGARGVNPP